MCNSFVSLGGIPQECVPPLLVHQPSCCASSYCFSSCHHSSSILLPSIYTAQSINILHSTDVCNSIVSLVKEFRHESSPILLAHPSSYCASHSFYSHSHSLAFFPQACTLLKPFFLAVPFSSSFAPFHYHHYACNID